MIRAFMHEEDEGAELWITVEEVDPDTDSLVASDLSSATEISLLIDRPGALATLTKTVTPPTAGSDPIKFATDGTDGVIVWTVESGDIPADAAGLWKIQPIITYSAGVVVACREMHLRVYDKIV